MKKNFYKYFLMPLIVTAGVTAFLWFNEQESYSQVTYPVTVANIRFLYGVGRNPVSPAVQPYYRGYGLPGTLIEITAQMTVSGNPAPMYGDVVFTVQYTDGTNSDTFEVTIPSGRNIGTAAVPYSDATGLSDAWISQGSTIDFTYSVTGVAGDYAGALQPGSPTRTINWDRQDPPPVPVVTSIVAASNSFRLFWTPIDSAFGTDDYDFYEYRVHYREAGQTALRAWDGSNDPTMRGLTNNTIPGTGTDQTTHFLDGRKYTIVTGLKLFTKYEYYLSAVDIYGNESDISGDPALLTTLPYSIMASISDGIDSFTDFSDLNSPESRSLRETNIEVELNVVTSGTPPDTIRVWFANFSDNTDIVNTATNTINQGAFTDNSLYSTDAVQKSANKWVAYLSTQTAVIEKNNPVRFIVETVSAGVSAFSDSDITDDNPNDDEWTFYVGGGTKFKPWPVRILNNVITRKNPVAYPSYYLTDDAYVTIKIFDIKGRPVAILMDDVFRRGGQNIKEDGWRGTNKARKKLGVGLYYMHFKAKRARDGKTILNEFRKVVMTY